MSPAIKKLIEAAKEMSEEVDELAPLVDDNGIMSPMDMVGEILRRLRKLGYRRVGADECVVKRTLIKQAIAACEYASFPKDLADQLRQAAAQEAGKA